MWPDSDRDRLIQRKALSGAFGISGVETYDLLVVGGGINGAGIARDAAGRGLRVLLCEQGDLAGYTSSASTKLIHGGLRYLQYYEFNLVTKALREREVLLRIAPHIISPVQFVMPHNASQRPSWMIRAGLLLYDHLGERKLLPPSAAIKLRWHAAGRVLDSSLVKGFSYWDCRVQDARLVLLNAMDAAQRGATVLLRTRCVEAHARDREWYALLRGNGNERQVRARVLVNATGPWVTSFLDEAVHVRAHHSVRLVQGSHIVVPKCFEHDFAYIFQNDDGRIVFAIPFEQDFTLIGTTETSYQGDPAAAQPTAAEVDYLCRAVSRYFREPVRASEVVWAYSGVRPLYDERAAVDASAASRDFLVDWRTEPAPLLSVFGGKITTYRLLAREAVLKLSSVLYCDTADWTGQTPLPGGDIADADFDGFYRRLVAHHRWLPQALAQRLARSYGTRVHEILGGARGLDGLGEHFGAGLYESELRYLIDAEWAVTAADVLWRRTKLGLHLSKAQADRVAQWLAARQTEHEAAPSTNPAVASRNRIEEM